MKQRHLLPERMDDPDLPGDEHDLALQGLRRLNRWSHLNRLIWQPIAQVAERHAGAKLRVLDIATGGGDVPIEICKRARKQSLNLEVEACDVSPQALRFANEECVRNDVSVNLFQLDLLADPIPSGYDIIVCTTFLHHLTGDQTRIVLQKMAEAAERRVVVVDLIRSRMNWVQVWLASRLLSRSPVVHYDGPQSVRAAFTREEILRLIEPLDLDRSELSTRWPCRFVLIGDKDDAPSG